MTHDYKRNGTTTLFAALNTATGEVYGLCQQRHRHQEWLKFLRLIDETVDAEKRAGLARETQAFPCALHADLGVVAEHDRAVLP